ncbi:hypothetical protein, partial [Escherichia coli]|uniref:hypothetical protein n=1 Tax=Escherichia coli TaxID=562 RepID=UPI001A7E0DDC
MRLGIFDDRTTNHFAVSLSVADRTQSERSGDCISAHFMIFSAQQSGAREVQLVRKNRKMICRHISEMFRYHAGENPKNRKQKRDRMCIRHTANTFACMRIPPVRASPDTPNVQNGES